jgi:hypothetical protein
MHLVIRFHPRQYPNNLFQVELINTLLLGTTFAWFATLLECQSPLLNGFETFLEEFHATFGDSNKEDTSNIKIQSFCQGSHSILVYASKFRYLASDISWGEITIIS